MIQNLKKYLLGEKEERGYMKIFVISS